MWEWQSLLQTSHLCVVLSSPVLRCCFRALLHYVRSSARPSQPSYLFRRHLYIAGEGGRWFSSPATTIRSPLEPGTRHTTYLVYPSDIVVRIQRLREFLPTPAVSSCKHTTASQQQQGHTIHKLL